MDGGGSQPTSPPLSSLVPHAHSHLPVHPVIFFTFFLTLALHFPLHLHTMPSRRVKDDEGRRGESRGRALKNVEISTHFFDQVYHRKCHSRLSCFSLSLASSYLLPARNSTSVVLFVILAHLPPSLSLCTAPHLLNSKGGLKQNAHIWFHFFFIIIIFFLNINLFFASPV